MAAYIRAVIRLRWLVLALIVALTALAGVIVSGASIVSTIGGLFLGESPAYQDYVKRAQSFGNDELLVIAVEDVDLRAPDARARLAQVVLALRAHPELGRVTSALDAAQLRDDEGALMVETFAQRADTPGVDADALLTRLCQDPKYAGLLISADCRHPAVLVELRRDEQRSVEHYPRLVREVTETFVAQGFAAERLRKTGWIAVLAEVMEQTLFNLTRMLPLVGVVLLIAMLLLFRRLWPVLITGAVSSLGVVWTLGFGVQMFERIDVIMALCPIFILIISCADVVHLCSAYLLELERGASKEEAIQRAGAEVGEACLFTSLTTFAGFVSIALVPAPVFRQSGLLMGFGVAVSLLLALTLTPVLFHLLPAPVPTPRRDDARPGLIDTLLAVLSRLTRTRPKLVVTGFAVFTAVAGFGVTQLNVETDMSQRLDPAGPVRTDQRFFQEHFAGANSLDIFIEAQSEGGLLEPELLARVARLQEEIAKLPGVDRAGSLVDVVRAAHHLLAPGAGDLPDSRAAVAQYLLLLEMGQDELLGSMIDDDRRVLRLHARLRDEGFLATHTVGASALELATKHLGDQASATASGLTYLLGEWLDVIVESQRDAILAALFTILVMMVLALRSLRAGLWSMIPNTLPLLALIGYVGLAWDRADSDAYIVCLVAIGVGVDDTIHFLVRYRRERKRAIDVDAAIEASFAYAGRAIIITSIILVAGFAPLATSGYFTTRIFGTLLPGCLLVALAADLMLVPALVKLGAFKFGGRTTEDG